MKFAWKILLVFFVAGIFLSGWWLSQPTQIVDTHKSENWSYVLVKNFPITDQGKISWWEDNKSILINKYNIPNPNDKGNFTIVVWDIGKGYREIPDTDQGSDLFCFEDMKIKANCIEKKLVFKISHFDNDKTRFDSGNNSYLQSGAGSEIKQQ